MELSVIILNYNARVFLELCVESVLRATKNIDAEIIVADNDSTDDSVDRMCKSYPQIKVIKLDDNYGFSKGNNVAVEQAQGEFICLVNPDVIVGEQVFENCLAFFKRSEEEVYVERSRNTKANSNKTAAISRDREDQIDRSGMIEATSKAGFLGIKLIDGKGKYLPESKRRVPTRTGVLKKLLGFSGRYYDERIGQNQDGITEVLVGAYLFGKRKVYKDLGGLDERYFMYGEDMDLCYTAIKAGFYNHYLGTQKAIHFKGESTIKDAQYLERFYGAMHLYYEKHYPKGKWLTNLLQHVATRFSKRQDSSPSGTVDELSIICVTNDPLYKPEWAAQTILFKEFLQDFKSVNKYVFDTNSLKMTALIDFMDSSNYHNLSYRFLNNERTAYVGSDSSTHRGEARIL